MAPCGWHSSSVSSWSSSCSCLPSSSHPRSGSGAWEGNGHDVQASVDMKNRIRVLRSEEHTSELQSLMRISYAVFCLKKKTNTSKDLKTYHRTEEPTKELP